MAEGRRMTAAEAVDKLMASEHADVIRESVAVMVGELIEAEVAALVGAELGERAPERRTRSATATASAAWDTRVGELELAIPKLRSGPAYFPSFLEPRRRAEQALVAVVQEAYVNGVSTRKVDRVVEQLGVRMSKDQVCRLCRAPGRAGARSGSARWRAPTRICGWTPSRRRSVTARTWSKALVIAYGVHETGRREVIGLDVGQIESEAFWREFLRALRRRGLDGVRLCVSDAHEGLKNAIARVLAARGSAAPCTFVRDMHQHCRPSQRSLVSAALREVFNADGYEQARERVSAVDRAARARRARRSPSCCSRPRRTCWPSTASRPSTGASCAQRTRSSASTARSAAAQTSSASSPTTRR